MLGTILFKLFGLFGGGTIETIVARVADHFRQQANNELARYQSGVQADTQIALARLDAELETRKIQAGIMQADRGWRVTAWIRPLLVYPCILHFGAIMLDSTFLFGWGIARLPPPYDLYEQTIILSFFIARPFEKAARVFAARRK
jgi:hypothetical protein